MPDDIKAKVTAIIAEQAMIDPDQIKMQDTLESLGIDSLGLVEAIFAIEEMFDVQVPFNANDPAQTSFDISSVESIVNAVKSLVQGAG